MQHLSPLEAELFEKLFYRFYNVTSLELVTSIRSKKSTVVAQINFEFSGKIHTAIVFMSPVKKVLTRFVTVHSPGNPVILTYKF